MLPGWVIRLTPLYWDGSWPRALCTSVLDCLSVFSHPMSCNRTKMRDNLQSEIPTLVQADVIASNETQLLNLCSLS